MALSLSLPEHNQPAQTPDQAEAAFQEALATARLADLVVMALGETEDMSGEYAARVPGPAGAAGGAAQGRGGPGLAGGAGAVDRPPTLHRVGSRARGGDPGGLGAG
jgi:hypothetical protein